MTPLDSRRLAWEAPTSSTLATIGYRDIYPVTGTGRFLAVLLMGGGIVIVGTASAIVVSYITERVGTQRVVTTGEGDDQAQPSSSASAAA